MASRYSPTTYLLFRIVFAVIAMGYLTLTGYSPQALGITIAALIVYALVVKHFDYLDPFVAFLAPWLLILAFSLLPVSDFTDVIHPQTFRLAFVAIFTALLVAGAPSRRISNTAPAYSKAKRPRFSTSMSLAVLDMSFLALTILNIVLAGYIPLLRGLISGDTGYLDFGVHGLYGFYLAFSNALAIFYFFLFLRTNNWRYLTRYSIVVFIFVLFVTRQNILSTACESLVVYSLVRRRIGWKSIVIVVAIVGVSFSLIGAFRSGEIKDIAGIKAQYRWLPAPVFWVYSYSYFNFANLDNLVVQSSAPYYNGSSLALLVPSFLRPSYDMGQYLAVVQFNVSSYLFPVYADAGLFGVVLITALALWRTAKMFLRASTDAMFGPVASYAVLYFCALFSFFVNFWFYLPVICQLIFIWLMANLAEAVIARDQRLSRRRPLLNKAVGRSGLAEPGICGGGIRLRNARLLDKPQDFLSPETKLSRIVL